MNMHKLWPIVCLWMGMLLAAVFFVSPAHAQEQKYAEAPQEVCDQAWTAFLEDVYTAAIELAQECIDAHEEDADNEQDRLFREEIPLPPTGPVASSSERKRIRARVALNNVGRAYFVQVAAAVRLFRQRNIDRFKVNALDARAEACRYEHARFEDPEGYFRSPCQEAANLVREI